MNAPTISVQSRIMVAIGAICSTGGASLAISIAVPAPAMYADASLALSFIFPPLVVCCLSPWTAFQLEIKIEFLSAASSLGRPSVFHPPEPSSIPLIFVLEIKVLRRDILLELSDFGSP